MDVRGFAGLAVSPWPNGAGRKADIAAGDGWMAGFAWLERDAPFSSLPGMDRTITLVDGPGFTLDIAGQGPLAMAEPYRPAPFDGGAPTQCRVTGPCRVLNVMTARGRLRHQVTIHEIIPSPEGEGFGGGSRAVANIVVALRGVLAVDGVQLAPLDSAVLERRAALSGDSGALAATLTVWPA